VHLKQRSGGVVEEGVKLLWLVDILETLSQEEVEEIDLKYPDVRLVPGETFFVPTDPCESLFILKRGRVRIYRTTPEGREFTLAVVESGTVFGEEALMKSVSGMPRQRR
jgi:CRP/FNR family cyclic AMP-dependent transcriptional regulator